MEKFNCCSSCFVSGNIPVKTIKSLNHAGIVGMSMHSYNTIQSFYIVPATLSLWEFKQHLFLDHVLGTGQALKLSGDARCSSPGHTVKYGSYTLMDVQTSKVVDIQLVQFMKEEKVYISDLVTDRHSQVKKYIRTQQEGINHWFDVWHMAKGLKQWGRRKQNIVLQWSRSISNHMYWCAASNGELVRHKWTSILNHISDVHESLRELFPKCLHDDVNRNWIKSVCNLHFFTGNQIHVEVEQIVFGRLLLKDIQKLSPAEQTPSSESFHNTIFYFATKSRHYFSDQMKTKKNNYSFLLFLISKSNTCITF
ncbi:hypothetical protein ACJMK2_025315 [Sinanodonta woodiana]|uniref:Uncharacterized protein n=1 Tax=Sinanodonta woodiana TaxID=1069815 RepID=A0ABD3XG52_SINWO